MGKALAALDTMSALDISELPGRLVGVAREAFSNHNSRRRETSGSRIGFGVLTVRRCSLGDEMIDDLLKRNSRAAGSAKHGRDVLGRGDLAEG